MKMSGLMVYEEGGLSDLKIIYLWAKCFVVPFLNVAKNTSLGFISFLILCRDIKKQCCDIFSTIN